MARESIVWEKPNAPVRLNYEDFERDQSNSGCCSCMGRSKRRRKNENSKGRTKSESVQSRSQNGIPVSEEKKPVKLSLTPQQTAVAAITFQEIAERLDCVSTMEEMMRGVDCFVYVCDQTNKITLKKGSLKLAVARRLPALVIGDDYFVPSSENASSSNDSIAFLKTNNAPVLFDGTSTSKLKNFVVVPVLDSEKPVVFVFKTEKAQSECLKCVALLQTYHECCV